ncbi:MAG: GMC oxidoreductase [Chthoniobacter sp.]|uniref:GMC oxidoreductase n=1 Tax=Chthoniobacter sp. TaxID=2510640 RepID=UPI0032AC4B1E
MFYVIGSGPAAISAAIALTGRGLPVTILDAGRTLEKEKQEILHRLGALPPGQWPAADLDTLRGGDQAKRQGSIHVKLTYGSDYPYAGAGASLLDTEEEPPFHYSEARGGLSNVWGASQLPARAEDIADWPISLADLEPHYRAVFDFMPTTAVTDDLDSLLPTYTDRGQDLRPSRQAEEFLHALQSERAPLRRAGLHFGRSRMAVTATGDAQLPACVHCGLCLYGCPYGLIYSTATTLQRLIEEKKVTYLDRHSVEKLEPHADGVTIFARDLERQQTVTFQAARVFVGTGVLPTAAIVLNSLGAFDEPVEMLDSQYFIYPFFRLRRTPDVQTEELHSLAQAFIEIDDPAISAHLVHLEIFSYSDFLQRALMATPLRFFLRFPWIAEQIFGRLLVVQGFLHSNDSGRLGITLRRNATGQPQLHVEPRPSRHAWWASLRAGLKLAACARLLGGAPVVPALQFAEPGRSYHSGGTFPMRARPGKWETDILGQPTGLERVHLLDASVFPSIPATTITLTVMANAHRIATQVADL